MLIFLCVVDFSKAQRILSKTLIDFRFECIGSEQTDDEIIIGVLSFHFADSCKSTIIYLLVCTM